MIVGKKKPIIISLNKGEVGRFLYTEDISPELMTVWVRPKGALSAITNRKEPIPKVPKIGGLLGPFYPPNTYSSKAIPSEGIMVVTSSDSGEKWLADQVEILTDKNFKDIRKQLSQHRIGELARGERIKTLEKGARGELKALKEASDVMEKGRKFEERFWEKR